MRRILIGAVVPLLCFTAAAARPAPGLEDAVLATMETCFEVEKGVPLATAAAARGLRPHPDAPQIYARRLPALWMQLRLHTNPRPNASPMTLCTLTVYGRVADVKRIESALVARATAGGYRISAPQPRPEGGTSQLMSLYKGSEYRGIGLAANEASDPAQKPNYVLSYGWYK